MFWSWVLGACAVGFFAAIFLYDTDLMWFEQGFTFGAMATMGAWGWFHGRTSNLHYLYWRDNLGIGLTRLAFWAAMAWCTFTLFVFGDSTITGIWNVFYLVMSYGVIKTFGLYGAESFGVRLRVDVYERKNFAAATFIAAFVLATGMIFGGSMWGESTPESLEYGGIFEILPSSTSGSPSRAWR